MGQGRTVRVEIWKEQVRSFHLYEANPVLSKIVPNSLNRSPKFLNGNCKDFTLNIKICDSRSVSTSLGQTLLRNLMWEGDKLAACALNRTYLIHDHGAEVSTSGHSLLVFRKAILG